MKHSVRYGVTAFTGSMAVSAITIAYSSMSFGIMFFGSAIVGLLCTVAVAMEETR